MYGIIAVIIGGIWFFFFREKPPNVETLIIRPTAFTKQVSVAGTLQAAASADLAFGQTGVIAAINVRSGDYVQAGTVLAYLQNSDLQANVYQALAELEAQRANLRIVQQGGRLTSGSGSRSALIDQQQAELNAAQGAVLVSVGNLNKTTIIAPFDGVVGRVDATVGETASPGTTEITLQTVGPYQIQSYIPELDIDGIVPGDRATVTLDAYGPDVPFSASVISVDSGETVRDNITTYKVKLLFSKTDPRLKSGMTANVLITTFYQPNQIVIPAGALYERNGKNFVKVKVGKNIEERQVQLGQSNSSGEVQIMSGLAAGGELVLNP